MRPATPPEEGYDAPGDVSGAGRPRDDDDDDGERRGPSRGGGWRASLAALSHPSCGRQLRLLVAFVILHNFKPSEPFLVEWLTTATTDGGAPAMSTKDVYSRLFPVFTYSRVPSLAAIALGSGAFGPKSSVVLGAACALATVLITVSCRGSFGALAASQATVALSFASHQALLGLTFATTPPVAHPAASHATKAATLASCALSALCGQVLRSYLNAPLVVLFVMSAMAQTAALVAAVALRVSTPLSSRPHRPTERPPSYVPYPLARGTWRLLTSGPGVAAWSAWSVGCAPAHSFAATNWQALVRVGRSSKSTGTNANGWFAAAQYACACATAVYVGDLAYRDDNEDDWDWALDGADMGARRARRRGASLGALTSTPFVAAGLLATCAALADVKGSGVKDDLPAMIALLAFNCVFEATSCVCAANIGRHARAAAEDGAGAAGGVDNEDEDAASEPSEGWGEEETRLGVTSGHQRLDAFGGRVTALFVMISAAGYLLEAALTALCGWGGRGGLGVRDRFLVHAAWLAVAGCGLVVFRFRSRDRAEEGDYVALEGDEL